MRIFQVGDLAKFKVTTLNSLMELGIVLELHANADNKNEVTIHWFYDNFTWHYKESDLEKVS